ncbi:hypothetical protein KSD_20830 [Ktedonobacter sp. SOSP1-85]|nr:hypothetical protein KSD_20830 [Ktedonobacter sp. SOSP1-85]
MIEAQVEGAATGGGKGLRVGVILASEGRLALCDIEHELEGEGGLAGARVTAEEGQASGEEVVDGPSAGDGRGLDEVIEAGEGHEGAGEEIGVGLLIEFCHVSLHRKSRGTFSRGIHMEGAQYDILCDIHL